ncbi:unnamed protein product, partial [Rhizoctonia solani]
MWAHSLFLLVSFIAMHRNWVEAGNTTCLTTSVDWFTQSVGETPCRVYEQLRQICNPKYEVGNMDWELPGDKCDVGDCCCNTVAFALSMLCMNCQYGREINAPDGTYPKYLNTCGQITNTTLPAAIQKAACSSGIKLPSYVYRPSWQTSGAWYYEYTRSQAELKIQSGENGTEYKCNGLIANESTSAIPVPTSDAPLDKTHIPTGGIIGFTLGGIALLCLGAICGYLFSNWRTRRESRR